MYNLNKYIICFFSIYFIGCINVIIAQNVWIDKNENQDYVARHECSFVQSGNTFILFGGREQAKRLDVYNYKENKWTLGASAPIEFNHFQAIEYDGLIWIVGAFKSNNFPNEVPADHVYMYNPALNAWLKGPEIPKNRKRGGAGLVMHNDKFYLVAGNTKGHNGGFVSWFDQYDPLNNTWKQLNDAPRSRDHFSAVVINDKIYAASGRKSGGPGGTFAPLIPQVDIYDLKTKRWSTLENGQNLPTPRAGASCVNFNNELFVIGGEGEQSGPAFKKVEAYNPSTNQWTTKTDLNFGRHGTQAIVSGPGIFIAGGSPVQAGGRMHNMEVYNNDKPVGVAIEASILTASNKIDFEPNQTKNIPIISSGGNAGNFISKIEIIGVDASSFKIQKSISHHLIKSSTKQDITITASTLQNNKQANLVITYDNQKKLIIKLAIL
ncbi:galactose oxidase [Aquimarina sp. AD10]|uniref:Kelch repeat-containing protein n=1 Tax=Aquimarina sp. AD10 TaxID=1714849 RepID=UPI000E54A8AC|nr:kelch repeat-containing protein [Aquimarina sp. AD10]AXT59324.1 galactose oxidase [Aquimarina sp. AD10]RKM95169.1 galactose oxidase [Aquimarina sp. AD10]